MFFLGAFLFCISIGGAILFISFFMKYGLGGPAYQKDFEKRRRLSRISSE